MRSTASGVGGMTGRPSLQSRSAKKRFTASSPSGVASISTVNISVALPARLHVGGRAHGRGEGRQAPDNAVGLLIHHAANKLRRLAGGGVRDGDKRRAGLSPAIDAGFPGALKAARHDRQGGNAGAFDGNHVMGKPRRATASMGRGADDGVHLLGDAPGLVGVDVIGAAERRPPRPQVAAVALEI